MHRNLVFNVVMLLMITSTSMYFGINAYGSQQNVRDDNSLSTWEGRNSFSLSDLGRALSSF
ncbi:hypothetical protein Syn7502_01445 [Synechococcus sp. PCC 7502]|nr:hypothetical protein Syn7502_01445 [Synechococcus sp. PCC 7502]